ncbi:MULTISPECIES: class I adenylate-forming enzyme family protein [unclassified Brenneria]|uniref:class I adenylate-forming enzyme family protein n=1 Tax=unclassified Brenneria TaxID=2634434 RepID=UPI001554A1EE|nr:AMP-binding protein [Brenneria sp. hezel4-2-4]MEE3651058.1 AMP-binding protein [Brenneria sp. HEZEL_4_2_4]NPD01013.1 AMP-binding protein [Brenneria sp. hezel4-2-4]
MSTQPATLQDILLRQAAKRPDAPFIVAGESPDALSFAQLLQSTTATAAWLHEQGCRPGDNIAFLSEGGFHTVRLALSLMLAGYVVAPLNLLATDDALARIIPHSDARIIFTTRQLTPRLQGILQRLPAQERPLMITRERWPAAEQPLSRHSIPLYRPAPAQPALLMYTSGTTGNPKGVLLSHANLFAAAGEISRWHRLGPQDRLLSTLPVYHINGWVIGVLVPLFSGGSLVAMRRFSVSAWWKTVENHRCTWLNLVPTMIAFLLNADTGGARRYPRIRFARSASAPLPQTHHEQFEQRFGIPVIEGMGMTESSSLVFCNPHAQRVFGSVGLPCGVEAAVINKQGERLADNRVGEIILHGAGVMNGYYNDAVQTASAIDRDGWLHTGDLGYRNDTGFYFVTGRLKELIIKGGENIAPREIDDALVSYPTIMEAAAFAIADADYGQDIAAAIVLKAGCRLDEEALREWCGEKLGKYKTPRYFYLVTSLPRGASGKIQRLKLGEQLMVNSANTLNAQT